MSIKLNISWCVKGATGLFVSLFAGLAYSTPELTAIIQGEATYTHTANETVIHQASQKAIFDWHSFNIASNEAMHFEQPQQGVALNRINSSQGASEIFGKLSATGQIILVNSAGFHFGPTAYVNVGGLIATTNNISNESFLSSHLSFDQATNNNSAIFNEGFIQAAENGLIALVGNNVSNQGIITATLGNIILASGKQFAFDFYGDQLINFKITESADLPYVSNTGSLLANGGKILLTAKAAQTVLDNVINMSGIAEANSAKGRDGEIILFAENGGIISQGKITAEGGKIKLSGKKIKLTSAAKLSASSDYAGGEILIGGSYQGVRLKPHADTIEIDSGASIAADARIRGNGGKVVIWANENNNFHGSISARGGLLGGDGGFIETSGAYLDITNAKINLTAPKGKIGEWLLDPTDIYITDAPSSNLNFVNSTYTSSANSSTASIINAGELGTQLQTANITLLTTNSAGTGNGDIIFDDPSNLLQTNWGSAATTLTLQADRHITLNSNLTFTGSGKTINLFAGQTNSAGSVNLNNSIDGSINLNIRAGSAGNTVISAMLGNNVALTSLNLNSKATFNTSVIKTSLNQLYTDTVTLNTPVTLIGATFTLPNIALNNYRLTLNTTSYDSVINGVISGAGGLTKMGLGTLTLGTANTYKGSTIIKGGVLTIGADASLGAPPTIATERQLVLDGGTLASSANFTLNANRRMAVDAGGGSISQSNTGQLSIAGNVDLGSNTLYLNTNRSQNILFNATITGTGTLITNGLGSVTFRRAVNIGELQANNQLVTFNTEGSMTTSGNQYYPSVTLLANASMISGGDIWIFQVNSVSPTPSSLAINSKGSTTISNNTGSGGAFSQLAITAGNGIYTHGAYTLGSGGQIYNGEVYLLGNDTFSANNAPITFNGAVNSAKNTAYKLIINTNGAATFNGNIGNLYAFSSISTNSGGTIILNGSSVTTSGALGQTFNSAVSINNDTTFSAGNGSITFASTLDSLNTIPHALTLNSQGTINFLDKVGGTYPLASITTDAGGYTNIQGGLISTSSIFGQKYQDTLILGADALLYATQHGSISIENVISNNNKTLSINTDGDAVIKGAITTGSGGLVQAGIGTLSLQANNTYTGATRIIAGTLNITTDNNLGATSSPLIFDGGTLAALSSFTINASRPITINSAGAIFQTGDNTLTFNGSILNGTGTGNIIKKGKGSIALGGNNSFTGNTYLTEGTLFITNKNALGTQGKILLEASAGAKSTLDLTQIGTSLSTIQELTLNSSASASSAEVVAGGNYILQNDIRLIGNNNIFTINNGNIILSGIIKDTGNLIKQGSNILTIGNLTNTYTGQTIVREGTLSFPSFGNAGMASALGAPTSDKAAILIGSNQPASLLYTGASTETNRMILLNGTGTVNLTTNNPAATVILDGAIDHAGNLILQGPGNITINGAIGANQALTNLTVSGGGITTLNNYIYTTQNQTFNNSVVVGKDILLSTQNGNIIFNHDLNGPYQITLQGGNTNNQFAIVGRHNLLVKQLLIDGGLGNNTLQLDLAINETNWQITGTNSGIVSSIISFNNVGNLIGGNQADNFMLAGGKLTGSVEGGQGSNSLTSDNLPTIWKITDSDIGNVTGIDSGFSHIQYLIAGSNNNQFNFTNFGKITGKIIADFSDYNNSLNFTNYADALSLFLLPANSNNELNSGSIFNHANSEIAKFSGIQNIIGNGLGQITVQMIPITVEISAASQGKINNFSFSNFSRLSSLGNSAELIFSVPASYNPATGIASIEGKTMQFTNFSPGAVRGKLTEIILPLSLNQALQTSLVGTTNHNKYLLRYIEPVASQAIVKQTISQIYDQQFAEDKLSLPGITWK